jgi:ABC-type multidrug transport system fused ATPase/permease subunit
VPLIAVSVPILLIAVGLIVVRMVPLFRKMQTRIDTVNRVLREQLTGIRVVRAFVRETQEANQDVTDVARRSGRLMALMFPIVMLVLNVSSVAQRVSSIIDADQILVLEDGRIVGRGTHEQLLESNTTYQEIVSSQLTAEEAA